MKERSTTLSRFFVIGRHIRSRMARFVPRSLTSGQIELLSLLSQEGPLSMRDIAKHFKITAPSATSLVHETARGGYVTRAGSAKDRREVRISLSRKGEKVSKTIVLKKAAVLEELFAPLSPSQRNELDHILDTIIKNQ